MNTIRQLIVKQRDFDLTRVAVLALVGYYLKVLQPPLGRLDATVPINGGMVNSDVVRSYPSLLAQGKSDFDAIENYRGDTFVETALGIHLLPLNQTLRQRMNARVPELFEFVPAMMESLQTRGKSDHRVLPSCGWLPLNAGTFSMDNG